MLAGIVANAQTNEVPNLLGSSDGILQQVWDSTAGSTNFAIVAGGGRGLTGNKNLVFADAVYDLSQNAGLIIGYDNLFSNDKRMGSSSASVVKGGLNLKADLYPLKRFGFGKFKVTPFAAYLVATPTGGTSNNGGIAQIALVGADYETAPFWGIRAHIGGFYENRTGQGNWDGNYICGHVAISKGF